MNETKFNIGDDVSHAQYGIGTVVGVDTSEGVTSTAVEFKISGYRVTFRGEEENELELGSMS